MEDSKRNKIFTLNDSVAIPISFKNIGEKMCGKVNVQM